MLLCCFCAMLLSLYVICVICVMCDVCDLPDLSDSCDVCGLCDLCDLCDLCAGEERLGLWEHDRPDAFRPVGHQDGGRGVAAAVHALDPRDDGG